MSEGGAPEDPRVLVLALDSAELGLVRCYAAEGVLPNMAALLRDARFAELTGPEFPELAWAEILTGCTSQTAGYGSPLALSPDYAIHQRGAYDFAAVRPFYGACAGRGVIVFDPPQARLVDGLDGVQILGWGSHSPLGPSVSDPPGLLDEIRATWGPHPAFDEDWMHVTETVAKRDGLLARYLDGIERRTRICLDLMRRCRWDLMLVAFGEPHAAGHAFWHLAAADHPAAALYRDPARDPLKRVYGAVDAAIGRILTAAAGARVVLFSSHGMRANAPELGSLVFLPELLFRHQFGRPMLAPGAAGPVPPPLRRRGDWGRLVWAMQRDGSRLRRTIRRCAPLGLSRRADRLLCGLADGEARLEHPFTTPLHYMPPMWYRPYWRCMRAFALPSFSEGFVRLNLVGRERAGIVTAGEYGIVCDAVTRLVAGLRDARTGMPAVAEVRRSWPSAGAALAAAEPGAPAADLVVRWSERPIDVVDTPEHGRIGPLPFRQSGGHTPRGFAAVTGRGIAPGRLPPGRLVDLAPTILDLLGAPRPNRLEGHSLIG